MAAGGYFGRALVVDVGGAGATASRSTSTTQVLRAYLGGVGLGTWLLHRLAPAGVDPLAPEAPLAFVFSPLVGTPLTTSAKFAVVAKSPLTGPAHRRARVQPVRHRRQADRPRRDRGPRAGRRAVGRARRRRTASASKPRPELAGLPAAEAETAAAGAVRPRLAQPRRSGPPGSAASATRRSATTAGTPAAAGSARCSGPRTSRPSWSGPGPRPPCADAAAVLAAAT